VSERLLGVDPGQKKTGLAWSGPGGLSEPLKTVPSPKLLHEMKRLCDDLAIDRLVFGLPLRNGKLGSAARVVRRKALRLAEALNLPCEFVDEAETTDEARSLRPGVKDVDALAALLILERYLDHGPWSLR
jgi:putative Holliday junction resolvase